MTQVPAQSSPASAQKFDHSDADLCVACGLCLPVCPTYRLTQDENESPRGRLSLIRALATDQLTPTEHLTSHLHRCTLCRACESVCPANVGFGEQMSQARHWLLDRHQWPQSLPEKLLLGALRKGDKGVRRFSRLASAYQHNPLRGLLNTMIRVTGMDLSDKEMPSFARAAEFESNYPASGTEVGEVFLFKGCLQNQTDPETLPAAIKLLTGLGYRVEIPRSQTCCGGLHHHSGKGEDARTLAQQNLEAFENARSVVGVASGCGGVIKEYGQILGDTGKNIAAKFQDITAFLSQENALESAKFTPLSASVLVHEPCSHRNQLKQNNLVYKLLGSIPDLKVSPLPGNEFCCGGAGSYSITEPALSKQMREPKLDALAEQRPDYLVTTNIGCALHIRSGLAARGIELEILHPVTLLARQLNIRDTDGSEYCDEPGTIGMV